ncbi:alpha-1,2-fucosyltransferase [Flavobacterium sp. T12S277]|uniref:alpha-1,2-fucosyltransferase n=1 Tax=Flavobacterium sp. T12S277 TaxID=3402752 RepID=UPI003AD99146
MITYSKLGKKGNLGNQLFQIASTIGLAVENRQDFLFPDWKYQSYFKNKLPLLETDLLSFIEVEEKEYNYYKRELGRENYDILGWLQTEKYFDKELAKHYFEFSEVLTDRLKKKYQEAFAKPTILISIRRGDFVDHPDYLQLPIHYYLNSLARFFPDWQARNLIVLSDDINYCKFHFSFLENAFFGDQLNEAEQLCLGSLCNDFIISNSTFSWWSAWLGQKKNSKIVRPHKNFDGLKSLELDDKDYYPENWINYNYIGDKPKLENLAFYIETKKNRETIKNYISDYFDVNIVFEKKEIDTQEDTYFLKKDYLLPPFLLYASWLELKKSGSKNVINSVVKTFKVSNAFNHNEFLVQKDFGLFSKIFSFPKTVTTSKHNYDSYLQRNKYKLQESDDVFSADIVLCFFAGKFLDIGGYSYSLKKYVRQKKIQLKKRIKKMLSIK